jgi:hypothetical protein
VLAEGAARASSGSIFPVSSTGNKQSLCRIKEISDAASAALRLHNAEG